MSDCVFKDGVLMPVFILITFKKSFKACLVILLWYYSLPILRLIRGWPCLQIHANTNCTYFGPVLIFMWIKIVLTLWALLHQTIPVH